MISEEELSGEEIDIYVKLFLSACIPFGKAVKKSNKREKDFSKKSKEHAYSSSTNFFHSIEHARNGKISWKYQRNMGEY